MAVYFSRDELMINADNSIYKLVILATKRALEIAEGAPKLVDVDNSSKATTVALMEIGQGRVRVKVKKD